MQGHAQPIDVRIPNDGITVLESIHGPAFRMAPRVDPFHKLILVGRGSVDVRSDGQTTRSSEGGLVFVPRDVQHQIEDVAASTLFLLCFSDQMGAGLADWSAIREQMGDEIRAWTALPFASSLLPLWRRALAEQERGDIGSRALLKAETVGLLVRLARSVESFEDEQSRMDSFIDEIGRTSFEPWTVDQGAAWVGVSRRQFTKFFKAATGMTFVDYLTAQRIDRVKELLASGGYTVAGAAYTCGFGDLAHFYRTFKRREEVTPLVWMRSSAEVESRGSEGPRVTGHGSRVTGHGSRV